MTAVRDEMRRHPIRAPWTFAVGIVLLIVAMATGYGVWLAAVALLIPTAIAVVNRPQVGILAFSALLPFDGGLHVLGPSWTNPWKQVVILALFAATFFCPPEARAQQRRKLPRFVGPFLAFLAVGLVSAFFVDQTTALVGLRLSYFSAIIGLTIWRCPLSRRERDHLVTIFMILAVITSLIGIWQQIVGHEYLYNMGYAYNDNIRFTAGFTLRSFSTFNLPFPFGFYLMLAVLVGLPVSLAQPRRLRSKLFFLSLPIIATGLFFSFVRGAMLGLAVGLLYLAFHRYKLLVYGIPLVLVAALFIPSGTNLTTAVFSSSSLQDRTFSWGDRFELFAGHPFGTGIGTTGAAAEKAAKLKSQDPDATYVPDNSWLKVMFELGIFGVWFFVMTIVSMFFAARDAERRTTGIDRDFVNGVVAQMLAIMVSALVATYFELAPMDQLFWIMIGIVATIAPEPAPGPAMAGEAARALGGG
jgi:O-Antigen ligase